MQHLLGFAIIALAIIGAAALVNLGYKALLGVVAAYKKVKAQLGIK